MSHYTIKPKVAYTKHYCACGQPATKFLANGCYWTCQRCIELDRYVTWLHEKAAKEQVSESIYNPEEVETKTLVHKW